MADSDAASAANREAEAPEEQPAAVSSTSREPVPPSEDFVLHALHASDQESALTRLVALEVQPASGPGDNFLGELWRARVTLEDAAGARRTRALIIKRLPQGDDREEYVREARLFDVEAAMYRTALPAILRQLRRAYGDTFRSFWPQFVYSSLDCSELVMQDMRALDYTMANRMVGLDMEQSKAVIKHMALLHASSVAVFTNDPAVMAPFHESLFRDTTRLYLETYLRASVTQLALQLQEWPGFEHYADRLAVLEVSAWDMVAASLAPDELGFNVLNHGDLWVNNVLFNKGNGSSSLDLEVALIDWQNSVWTSPAFDLLYFMYTSPRDEVRREHGETLLRQYQGTLQQAMQALGVGSSAPSMESLRADLRQRFAIAIFPAIAELPNMLAPPELHYDISQYFEVPPPRNHAYGAEPYGTIIRRLLPLFEDCGVI